MENSTLPPLVLEMKEILSEDDVWIHGRTLVRVSEASPWHPSDPGGGLWSKLKANPIAWLLQSPEKVLEHMGIIVSPSRAREFLESTDDNFLAIWYLGNAIRDTDGDEVLKWIMGPIAVAMKVEGIQAGEFNKILPASSLNYFVTLLVSKAFDRQFAKPIFDEILAMKADATAIDAIVAKPCYKAETDDVIDGIIDTLITNNPDQVEKAKVNPKLIQWFVGQVMRESKGKANAPAVLEKLNSKLNL